MLLEGPKVEYVQRVENAIADPLSCLGVKARPYDSLNDTHKTTELSYVNQEDIFKDLFLVSPREIGSHQHKDEKLLKHLTKD